MAKNKTKDEKDEKDFKKFLLAKSALLAGDMPQYENPWLYKENYTLRINDFDDFRTIVKDCRFFYRRDALASTTINKLVDIGINDLLITKNGLPDNEFRVFEGLKYKLLSFAEDMALEFLISGLVFPEIKFATQTKEQIKDMGITVKKKDSLILPATMWVRDPNSIKIKDSILTDIPSYFLEIPEEMIFFILNEGTYNDGTQDLELYAKILAYYPEFVAQIRAGKREVLLKKSENAIRRRVLTDGPYPTPYLMAAIDPLKHKRTLRRMDYSVATKVLSAILHVKIGSDEFPMTEGEEDLARMADLKNTLLWRNVRTETIENIFQLFTDHTVEMNWVFPDTEALLNEGKYKDINEDIIFALGFPRTLIVGESERSGTSNPEYAAMSPVKTMENFREKILEVLKYVVTEVSERNKFKAVPNIVFAPINLHDFKTYVEGLDKLFQSGALSREDYAKPFGFEFSDQFEKRMKEQKELEKAGVSEYGASPFSKKPEVNPNGGNTADNNTDPKKANTTKVDKNESKK